jgi:hypothetical protein
MTTLTYGYQAFDKNKNETDRVPNIQVTFSIKLIVINPTLDPSPGIVDSSSPFFITRLNVGDGYGVSEEATDNQIKVIGEETKLDALKGNATITLNLNTAMNDSSEFKRFWAKWSSTIPEGQRMRNYMYYNNPNENLNYYALEVTQTFKGDINFAGFSQVDYLPVRGFYNDQAPKGPSGSCTSRGCNAPNFVFDDTAVNTVGIYTLTFNKEDIINKQVEAATLKIQYEQDLENYKSQLVAQSLDLILSTANYQPNNFTKVITRLLEFQQGTLITSLDYANNANLTGLYNLLSNLSTEISDLAGLYPSITIEDGEGIPYGDGIPNSYENFGWFFDSQQDGFGITTKDGSSVVNYAIITQNGVEILDTRDYESISGFQNFYPNDYIDFPPENTQIGDVFECTVYSTEYVESEVNFIHSNYGKEVDYINADINITRGLNGGIYNSVVESSWNGNISPSGTTWNSEYTADGGDYGFSNLDVVDGRNFDTFYTALDGAIGNNYEIPLIMHDETTDDYYTVQFTSWTQGINGETQGGGFAYTRRLINQSGTGTTFKDTLVWK